MSIRAYIHTANKRVETPALWTQERQKTSSTIAHATHLRLTLQGQKASDSEEGLQCRREPQTSKGDIQFYTDLE